MSASKIKRKYLKKTRTIADAVFFVSLLCGFVNAQNYNVCEIKADDKGNFTSMTITNPVTSLGIEKSFYFEVDHRGIPLKGKVTFLNGVERELNSPEEVNLMWAQFGGPQAFWDYNYRQGKIVSYNTIVDNSDITFGMLSRVFVQDGKIYIGKLTRASNKECVLIDVGTNNPIQIDKALIREIQQLK